MDTSDDRDPAELLTRQVAFWVAVAFSVLFLTGAAFMLVGRLTGFVEERWELVGPFVITQVVFSGVAARSAVLVRQSIVRRRVGAG